MTRHIVFVIFPGLQTLDLTGPLEVFAAASRAREVTAKVADTYRVEVVAEEKALVCSSSGIALMPARALREVRGPIDTLIVVGGFGSREAMQRKPLLAGIQRLAKRARRVASVCSGAFVLAAAGFLDGRRATTHWASCDELQRRFPSTRVEADPIFIRDGHVWTSAGVTAGLDLALAMVEDDEGPALAATVARYLVVFVRRPGGQSQFSVQLSAQAAKRAPLRELQAWICDHVAEDLSVAALAKHVAMSPRNFARAFHTETGVTPARYVERVRLEAARRLLETSHANIESIAEQIGFGTVETMRRAFARNVNASPKQIRERFTAHATPSRAQTRSQA